MKHFFIRIIKLYQRFISPIKPRTCRFYPTCSAYGLTSYERFGAFRGTILTVIRIAKCHPFHPGGVDHVPDKLEKDIDPKKITTVKNESKAKTELN